MHLKGGRTLERIQPNNWGSPQNPMSADDVRAKFRENAAHMLKPGQGRSDHRSRECNRADTNAAAAARALCRARALKQKKRGQLESLPSCDRQRCRGACGYFVVALALLPVVSLVLLAVVLLRFDLLRFVFFVFFVVALAALLVLASAAAPVGWEGGVTGIA